MTSAGRSGCSISTPVVTEHERTSGNLEERQALGHGVGPGLREHDDEIAVAEMAERMREADVAVLRLHRRIACDHAQTVGVAEPVEQRRELAGPRREGGRRAAGGLGDLRSGQRHAVSFIPQQLTIRRYVGPVTVIRRRPPPRSRAGCTDHHGDPMTPLDRAVGTLLGLACGDAVGTTLEFRAPGTFEPITDMFSEGTIAATLEDGTLLAVLQRIRRWFEKERASS